MKKIPISLIIITYNEEHNIGRCLDSVPFAAEKLIVDSGSTDRTREVAERHGARVVHQPWLGFGPQRNAAHGQATHDWILVLDADETLSPELARELEGRLPEIIESDLAGAWLPRTNDYMGAPLRWYRPMMRQWSARIYHRERARWTDAMVHESMIHDGPTVKLEQPLLHFHNPTLVHKQLKVLHYTEISAGRKALKKRRPALWALPLIYLHSFLKDYLWRLAVLDGGRGVIVSHMNASYAVYKRVRLYEMLINPEAVKIADRALQAHKLKPADE
jgi:glycosyltransferase involved in cell wall biosynthesis